MSTIRTNAIVDAAGGNTATVNGVTVAIASQAQAQAGTDNTTLMTPLRVKEAALSTASTATFTAPGTWTKPANVKFVKVTVVGGGGGGGSAPGGPTTTTGSAAGGGGTGIRYIPSASIPGPVAVTVGAGGTAAATGGTSSFGAFVSATGGAGGTTNSNTVFGAGGTATGGDNNLSGAPGRVGSMSGGGLGYSRFPTDTGTSYGGGGFDAVSPGTTPSPGPAITGYTGWPGVVIVEVFE